MSDTSPSVGISLGQLLRLKGMTEAAGTAVAADGASAPALTESYIRLRDQIANLLQGDFADEFDAAFPVVEEVRQPMDHPRAAARAAIIHEAAARRARTLLGQLAGWLDGLIAEATLEQRLRFEAEERVKAERRQPPGFGS